MTSFLKEVEKQKLKKEEDERYRLSHPVYQCGVGDIGFTQIESGGSYANTYLCGVIRVDEIDDEEVSLTGFSSYVKSKHAWCTVLAEKYSEGHCDVEREPSEQNHFVKWGTPKTLYRILKPLAFIEKCKMPTIGSDESMWDLGVVRRGVND